MATALEWLRQRAGQDWLQGFQRDGQVDPALTAKALADLALAISTALQAGATLPHTEPLFAGDISAAAQRPPTVLLATTDSASFLAWFCAVSSLGFPLVLGNPGWTVAQWREVAVGVAPDLVIADLSDAVATELGWLATPNRSSAVYRYIQSFPQILRNCGKPLKTLWGNGDSCFASLSSKVISVENQWILIPTGGSTGRLRFAIHRWETLVASALGLQASELVSPREAIHSCCVLPLFHVSGLMQFVRSLVTGGQLMTLPWQTLMAEFASERLDPGEQEAVSQNTSNSPVSNLASSSILSSLEPWLAAHPFFLSLVPTQLQRLMYQPHGQTWLRRFACIFLGGAPAWPALLEEGRRAVLPLAPTYGMTETASQVVTLSPKAFLQGASGCGQVLPHARIQLASESRSGQGHSESDLDLALDSNPGPHSFPLRIQASSLALGYFSLVDVLSAEVEGRASSSQVTLWPRNEGLLTDDLGYFDCDGGLQIVGRASDKIISGGENVFPASVEAGILATELVADAIVLGLPDEDWGERVVAVVVPRALSAAFTMITTTMTVTTELAITEIASPRMLQLLQLAIAPLLPKVQRPKQWVLVESLPRNAQGKIPRQLLREWLLHR